MSDSIDYKYILENTAVGVLQTKLDGTVIFVNEETLRISGFKTIEEFAENKTLARWKYEEDRGRFISLLRENGSVTNFEAETLRQNNETIWVLVNAKLIGNSIFSTIWDITEHKKQEFALKKSESRLAEAREIAHLGNWEWDISENEVHWSWEVFGIMGLSDTTPDFEKFLSVIHPDDVDAVNQAIKNSLKNRTLYSVDHRVIHPDGRERFVHAQGSPSYDESGRPLRMVGTVQDITDRKRIELELNHSRKLESLGQLGAGIAHEINTPAQYLSDNLSFVESSFSEIIEMLEHFRSFQRSLREISESDTINAEIESKYEELDIAHAIEEMPSAFRQMRDGIDRISEIVEAMNRFSYPTNDKKVPTDINEALKNTITVTSYEWKSVADVKTDFDLKLPHVKCFPSDVNQVFLNLLINSAQAIKEIASENCKGKITVSTLRVDKSVEIRISDTGRGIPKSVQDRIFDPFFTTKDVGSGIGQGLTIAHSIVKEKHGGDLYFETTEGDGTTFIVRLPIDS